MALNLLPSLRLEHLAEFGGLKWKTNVVPLLALRLGFQGPQ